MDLPETLAYYPCHVYGFRSQPQSSRILTKATPLHQRVGREPKASPRCRRNSDLLWRSECLALMLVRTPQRNCSLQRDIGTAAPHSRRRSWPDANSTEMRHTSSYLSTSPFTVLR